MTHNITYLITVRANTLTLAGNHSNNKLSFILRVMGEESLFRILVGLNYSLSRGYWATDNIKVHSKKVNVSYTKSAGIDQKKVEISRKNNQNLDTLDKL